MKIAIHHRETSFSSKWLEHCKEKKIPYKQVNCYSNSIIRDLNDCDALMWHFHHANPKDTLFAKQLIYSLDTAGKKVFPDPQTCWHFDDKVGQKYLLESVGAPLIPTNIFYDKTDALTWLENTSFPKVFKLRRGAGSNHVRLVNTKSQAETLVRKMFGKGFPQYEKTASLKERWRRYRSGRVSFKEILKGIGRFIYPTRFSKIVGNEKGYIYFQDFIAGNNHEIRVHVVAGKAFAVKQMNREGDFRASGNEQVRYDVKDIPEEPVRIALETAGRLKLQAVVIDFLYHDGQYLISEMSYGYDTDTRKCTGYWDESMKWHNESFDPAEWMVQALLKKVDEDKRVYR